MEPILQTKKLDLRYGAFQALYGIDTDIFPNEITALIGPSGCGKSTYLKTLNRMNDLVPGCKIDGAVLFHGHNVYGDKIDVTELRSRIGMVFQKPNPFPMSIYDNIAYAPRLHGVRGRAELDEIVERSLKSAAIWDETKDKLKKSALGLSGGQQQRLCIARALAVEPEVLSRRAHSTQSPPGASKSWRSSSKRRTPSSSSRTTCSRPRASRIRRRFSCSASSWRWAIRRRYSTKPRTAGQGIMYRENLVNKKAPSDEGAERDETERRL